PLYPAYVICDTARITRGSGQRELQLRSVPDEHQVRVTGLAAVPPAPRYGESDIGAFRVDLIPGHHAPESRSTKLPTASSSASSAGQNSSILLACRSDVSTNCARVSSAPSVHTMDNTL